MNAMDVPPQPPAVMPPYMMQPPPRRSGWPVAVGVVSIILSSMGLLCYGCGSFSTLVNPLLPPDLQTAAVTGGYLVYSVVSYCGSFVLSVWLLISGIGLCGRRGWSGPASLAWAVAKIAFVLMELIVGFAFLPDMVNEMNEMFEETEGPALRVNETVVAIVSVVLSVIALVWPVFLAIWFGRTNIRHEVETWRRARVVTNHVP
jgi:hypothetical protein